MSDKRQGAKDHRTGWPLATPDLPVVLRIQFEVLLREQSDFLDRTQKLVAAWTKRRHEGMAAAIRTFQKFQGCQGVGDMAAAYGEWLNGSMGRIMADMAEARDEALRLAAVGEKVMAALSSANGGKVASSETAVVRATNDQSLRGGVSAPAAKLARDVQP